MTQVSAKFLGSARFMVAAGAVSVINTRGVVTDVLYQSAGIFLVVWVLPGDISVYSLPTDRLRVQATWMGAQPLNFRTIGFGIGDPYNTEDPFGLGFGNLDAAGIPADPPDGSVVTVSVELLP